MCNRLQFDLSVAYADLGRREPQLPASAPVQSLRGEDCYFQMDQVYDLVFCASLCQQKTHGSNRQKKVPERMSGDCVN